MAYQCYLAHSDDEKAIIKNMLRHLQCTISDLEISENATVFLVADNGEAKTALFCFDLGSDGCINYMEELIIAVPMTFKEVQIIAIDLLTSGNYV